MGPTAILLVAHGSRHAEANDDLRHVAELLQAHGHAIVEPSYLELATPTIDEGAAACVTQGASCVVLTPYFLSAGVHVRRDLEAERTTLAERYPEVSWLLAEPLGRHPLLAEIVEQRITETTAPP